jgi:hypothetical protein
MPRVKPPTAASEKWSRVAPTRQQDFEAGVKDPGVDWARNTSAAKDSYDAGVQDAIQRGAFSKGVEKAGTERWRGKTVDVGAPRWAGGIRSAQSDYEQAITPVFQVIERTTLPPRGPRGDPKNYQRAEAMGRALAEARRRG